MSRRLVLLSSLAALGLSLSPALAQESGGIRLSAEALNTENLQERVLDHVAGQLQRTQLLRAAAAAGTQPGTTGANSVAAGANATNPAADRQAANQQSIARLRGDAGFLAGFNRGQPLAASRVPPPPPIDLPPPLVINAFDSPVTLGDNNIVHQQVSSSIAIGQNASAGATAKDGGHRHPRRSGSPGQPDVAATVQSAVSNALAVNGGSAHSVAANSSVTGRDDR